MSVGNKYKNIGNDLEKNVNGIKVYNNTYPSIHGEAAWIFTLKN